MIADSEISIVVQGPILQQDKFGITPTITKEVCKQVKKLLPQSELILSTWEGSNTEGISYDKLILNKDPGATWFNYENYTLVNNCNRLIISTLGGIKASTKKYIFKIRSDLFLLSTSFLKYFYMFREFDQTHTFVKNRILAFSLYSIKAHKTSLFVMERPFHISDWAYFGYKEDLLNLYDIPLTEEPNFSQWFLTRCKPFFDIEPHRLWRMPPEQYVTYNFLQKFTQIQLEHTADISRNNRENSEKLIANNFLVLDQVQFQLISLKYLNLQLLFEPLLDRTAIFFHTWLNDYCLHSLKNMANKKKYQFYIFSRKFAYLLFIPCFRLINNQTKIVTNLLIFYIKKIIKKNR